MMASYTSEYSSEYFPPAPVVEIIVRPTDGGGTQVALPAFVDSGADGTILPLDALTAVGARYIETRRMRGVTGHTLTVDMYLVTVQVGSYVLPGTEAIAGAREAEAILGRDVLNQFVVSLNGLAQVVEFTQ
jgi:predicted aspartyl protease